MFKHQKPIVLIRFSSRDRGNCAAISAQIQEYYGTKQIKAFTVDSTVAQPCCNCDYECLKAGEKCINVTDQQVQIMDTVCNANIVYFIVPNYCGYPCANYFAFNEKSVGYFNLDRNLMQKYMSVPKRFIIVSNTESDIFVNAMRQQTNGEPEILYMKTGKYQKRSINGDMMESSGAQADLKVFLDRKEGQVF